MIVDEGGEGIDGDAFGAGVVAPESVGEEDGGFGGGEGEFVGWFEVAVSEAVVDGGEAGGAGVAGETDLDGCGFSGEEEWAVAAHVLVEVDEDVDVVVADHFGELFVFDVADVLPAVGVEFELEGEGVFVADVGVAEDFEVGVVMVGEERGEIMAEGVVAEFGGDVADAETAIGGAVVGVRGGDGGEGLGVEAIEIEVGLVDGVGVEGGVILHDVEEIAGDPGGVGLDFEGFAVVGDGFIEEAEIFEGVGEIVVDIDCGGRGEDGVFIDGDGVVECAELAVGFTEDGVGGGGVGEELDGALSGFEGLFGLLDFGEGGGEGDVGFAAVGGDFDELSAGEDGGFGLSGGVEGGGEGGAARRCCCGVWRGRSGGSRGLHRFVRSGRGRCRGCPGWWDCRGRV